MANLYISVFCVCICLCVISCFILCLCSSGFLYVRSKPPIALLLDENEHYQVQSKEINKSQYNNYIRGYESGHINSSEIKYKELPDNKSAILWIHGFNDYYFHFHIGEELLNEGYNMYTITLPNYPQKNVDRKYLFYIDDLKKYFSYIDQFIEFIRARGINIIVLYGHSTGGLISTAYLHEGKKAHHIDKLILNAPFFDFHDSNIMEIIIKNVLTNIGKILPKFVIREGKNQLSSPEKYKDILSRYYFDQNRKITYPNHTFAGWINAVATYHQKIQKKQIKLDIPILVLMSSTSKNTCKGEQNGDCVLDVTEIKKYSRNLGKHVIIKEYNGAIHDVLLSKSTVVNDALYDIIGFLRDS